MSLTSLSLPGSTRQVSGVVRVLAVAAAAIVAIALDAAVAAVARGAGVSHRFMPLNLSSYAALTVVGIVAGAAGWALIRSRATNPEPTLRRVVPVVVILSFLPDLGIGLSKSMSSTTWGGVTALMIMHLLVAATALPAYAFAMPTNRGETD